MSTGVTLRENNLKELEGGRIMDSQGVLVGNRAALLARPELLAIVHELIERFEAHLTAGVLRGVTSTAAGHPQCSAQHCSCNSAIPQCCWRRPKLSVIMQFDVHRLECRDAFLQSM